MIENLCIETLIGLNQSSLGFFFSFRIRSHLTVSASRDANSASLDWNEGDDPTIGSAYLGSEEREIEAMTCLYITCLLDNSISLMNFWAGRPRNTQAKLYMPSFTKNVGKFEINISWDTPTVQMARRGQFRVREK